MSKFATKAAANMFCQARYEAAKSNERLSSREGAAEEIGIDRTRLARIELGSTIPYARPIQHPHVVPHVGGPGLQALRNSIDGIVCHSYIPAADI